MAKNTHSRLALALTIAACASGIALLAVSVAAGDIASAAGLAFTVIVFAVGAAIGDTPGRDTAIRPEGSVMERRKDFDDWVRANTRALHGVAYALTGGDPHKAKDLVQEALLALFRKWGALDTPGSELGFAVTVMTHKNIEWWRRRHGSVDVEWSDTYSGVVEIPEAITNEGLAEAMTRLRPAARTVLFVRFWLDLTQAETAVYLGLPLGTVKSQETRALGRLRLIVPVETARVILKHLEG